MIFRSLTRFLYKRIYPISTDKDVSRRELILNILLIGSIILVGLAVISVIVRFFLIGNSYNGNSPLTILFIFSIFVGLYFLSRQGYFTLASYALIYIYIVPTVFAVIKWSIYLPQAILTFALIIVIANILISTTFGFVLTASISAVLILLGYTQSVSSQSYDLSWAISSVPSPADAIIYAITFSVITLVSGLFNTESENALKRARLSEAALEKERNMLEIKVNQRTKELRKVQLEKMTQMYRFAEFGKLATGFFHDFSNSVNLVTLNLNELKKKDVYGFTDVKELISRAQVGLTHMEHFIVAAGKQINNRDVNENFSVSNEIKQVIQVLSYKAKQQHVHISLDSKQNIFLQGNPIKFHQLISNLLSNAIDSYATSNKQDKLITIGVNLSEDDLSISISDNGNGIAKKNLPRIFEPFFTTKNHKKGIGLGLSISQNIVINDFGGKISVRSKKNKGTTFVVSFPSVAI